MRQTMVFVACRQVFGGADCDCAFGKLGGHTPRETMMSLRLIYIIARVNRIYESFLLRVHAEDIVVT